MIDLYRTLWPLIRRMDSESAHALVIRTLKLGLAGNPGAGTPNDGVLATRLWDLSFANPVGLAAGFDKDAEVVLPVLRLGFAFVEVGSITPLPQLGNPRPRLFRLLQDRAVINRMGFNSKGLAETRRNLEACARPLPGVLGVNLGKNKDSPDAAADYRRGVEALGPFADYLVVNVSSPNTPGLRALQGRGPLGELLDGVQREIGRLPASVRPPLVVKIAPDLTVEQARDVADVALALKLDGITVGNTTLSRPSGLQSSQRSESGGLSGRPLMDLSTRLLARIYYLTEGKVPLIGVGGIESGETAYRKILAGASLVQLYTGLVYEGPSLLGRIKRDLVDRLRNDGHATLADAVGQGHEDFLED